MPPFSFSFPFFEPLVLFLIITTAAVFFLPSRPKHSRSHLPPLLLIPYELFQRSLQTTQPWLCEAQIECQHTVARLSRPISAPHASAASSPRLSGPLVGFHPRWCYVSCSCCCSLSTSPPRPAVLCSHAAADRFSTIAAPNEPSWPGPTPTELQCWLPWWVAPLFLSFCSDR